jgi:hypothetical protein
MRNWISRSILALCLWSLDFSNAVAAPGDSSSSGSWLLCYALVILGIALGLAAVCRPVKWKTPDDENK